MVTHAGERPPPCPGPPPHIPHIDSSWRGGGRSLRFLGVDRKTISSLGPKRPALSSLKRAGAVTLRACDEDARGISTSVNSCLGDDAATAEPSPLTNLFRINFY